VRYTPFSDHHINSKGKKRKDALGENGGKAFHYHLNLLFEGEGKRKKKREEGEGGGGKKRRGGGGLSWPLLQ